MSVETLAKSRPAAYLIWALLFLGQIASVGLFTSGFLLTRKVLPNVAEAPAAAPEFQRAVVLVVDAMRYDFISPQNPANGEYYLNKMPLEDIGGAAFQFLADPPTTTLQRLKGLTTGSLPTFIDAGSNFAGTQIFEDNWVLQAVRQNASVAFVGDDTWEALFGHILSTSIPYPSLDVRDLDTVDNGVKHHLPCLLANSSNKVVVGHLLGVDHVGHRYGPQHPEMARKLMETYEFIKTIAETIDHETILLVLGDHGMDQTGNHGGDSPLELWAGLWAYAKGRTFAKRTAPVNQIDFVPTISTLLGLPIPFNNLGFPISELLEAPEAAALATARQISRYAEEMGHAGFSGSSPQDAREYQAKMEAAFRKSWATFNLANIYKGTALMALLLASTISLYHSLTPDNTTLKARRMSYGAALGVLVGALVVLVTPASSTLNVALDLLAALAAGAALMTLSLPSSPPRLSWQNLLVGLIMAGHAASFFSNSFVVSEREILLFFTATIILVMAARCVAIGPVEQYLGIPCALLLALLIRASSYLGVCREENGPGCQTTFYEPASTITGYWALALLSALIVALPLVLRRSYTIGENFTGPARLCIEGGLVLALLLTTAYWSLDTAEVRGIVSPQKFETLKLIISRALLGLSFGAGPYIWANSNPCVSIDISKEKPKIAGYQNIFGAYAYLPIITTLWALLISSKPPGAVAVCGLVVVLYNLSDLLDLTMSKNSLLAQTAFLILGYLYFFYTGHQMTLVSIQWDAAFISATKLSYPISAITLFLNTMGPFVLAAMAAVLIALWRRTPVRDARFVRALLLRSTLGTMGLVTFQTLATMVATAVLRRHLMTWKIFAPRYIYGVLILLVVDLAALAGFAIGDHSVKIVTASFGG